MTWTHCVFVVNIDSGQTHFRTKKSAYNLQKSLKIVPVLQIIECTLSLSGYIYLLFKDEDEVWQVVWLLPCLLLYIDKYTIHYSYFYLLLHINTMLIPENYFFMCSFEVTRTVSSHRLQLMSSSSNHSLTQRQTVTVFSLSPVSQLSFQHGDARPINTQIKIPSNKVVPHQQHRHCFYLSLIISWMSM